MLTFFHVLHSGLVVVVAVVFLLHRLFNFTICKKYLCYEARNAWVPIGKSVCDKVWQILLFCFAQRLRIKMKWVSYECWWLWNAKFKEKTFWKITGCEVLPLSLLRSMSNKPKYFNRRRNWLFACFIFILHVSFLLNCIQQQNANEWNVLPSHQIYSI